MSELTYNLKYAAERAAGRLSLPPRFLASWFVAENGWEWPKSNNVGNISYSGEGVPTGGVFEGVTSVESNRVCVYDTVDHGADAFVLLLETPKADKLLTLDLTDLHACGSDIHAMCVKVGESNWAESHYDPTNAGPGSSIWGVYNSPEMASAFETQKSTTSESSTPTRATNVYVVVAGDTLGKISLLYHVPVPVLAKFNDIVDVNSIQVGEHINIPSYIRINPGDTVSLLAKKYGTTVDRIAKVNAINPDYIFVGHYLFV